jgi:hypothetical protein
MMMGDINWLMFALFISILAIGMIKDKGELVTVSGLIGLILGVFQLVSESLALGIIIICFSLWLMYAGVEDIIEN